MEAREREKLIAAVGAEDAAAVERFLATSLDFNGMAQLVEAAMARFSGEAEPGLAELESIDAEVRTWARQAELSDGAWA